MSYFEFEKMPVYIRASEAVRLVDPVALKLGRGRGYLKLQLLRSVNGMVANLVEGLSEFSPREKARVYRLSRREALEAATHVLMCRDLGLVEDQRLGAGIAKLHEVVAMLTALGRAMARRSGERCPHCGCSRRG